MHDVVAVPHVPWRQKDSAGLLDMWHTTSLRESAHDKIWKVPRHTGVKVLQHQPHNSRTWKPCNKAGKYWTTLHYVLSATIAHAEVAMGGQGTRLMGSAHTKTRAQARKHLCCLMLGRYLPAQGMPCIAPEHQPCKKRCGRRPHHPHLAPAKSMAMA